MGNCLDIPPPPPKHRDVDAHYVVRRSAAPSIRSDSIHGMPPGMVQQPFVHPYPPYAYPPPMIAIDPMTGQAYQYQPTMIGAPYYGDPMMMNGYYDYDGEEEHYRSHRRHRKKRENGEIPDANANTNEVNKNLTTVIKTCENPSDDVIRTEAEPQTSSTPRQSQVITATVAAAHLTNSNDANGTTTTTTAEVLASQDDAKEDAIAQEEIQLLYDNTRQLPVSQPETGTYVTYIQEDPPAPVPPQPEVEAVNDSDETAARLFIDEPILTQHSPDLETPIVVSSELRQQIGIKKRLSSYAPRDVVLSYGPSDNELMWRIKNQLEGSGLSTWVSNPKMDTELEGFTNSGDAIIDAKVMVVVLSPQAMNEPHLRDEVSLAHLTGTAIFPVCTCASMDVLAAMAPTLKLQLASYVWTELVPDGSTSMDFELDSLVMKVGEELQGIRADTGVIDQEFGEVTTENRRKRRQSLQRHRRLVRTISLGTNLSAAEYWDKHYGPEDSVELFRFRHNLMEEYADRFSSLIPVSNHALVMESLQREMGVARGDLLHKSEFVDFCTEEGTDQDVWERVRSVAMDTLAIRDVFDVGSTVRLAAIENIEKFTSPAVMTALCELLFDQDPNIRSVAVISLSRCMTPDDHEMLQKLMETMTDKDRLVREAACLSMGHLKAREAVPKLLHMWRNDVISHVREAAAAALRQIGGDDIDDAMRVTKVLADEIRTLTDTE